MLFRESFTPRYFPLCLAPWPWQSLFLQPLSPIFLMGHLVRSRVRRFPTRTCWSLWSLEWSRLVRWIMIAGSSGSCQWHCSFCYKSHFLDSILVRTACGRRTGNILLLSREGRLKGCIIEENPWSGSGHWSKLNKCKVSGLSRLEKPNVLHVMNSV